MARSYFKGLGTNLKKANWLIIAKWSIVIIVVLWIWRTVTSDRTEYFATHTRTLPLVVEPTEPKELCKAENQEGQCKECVSGYTSDGTKLLLPVTDPCFNMREICKQCILLEDHLFQKEKNCDDCCRKHSLAIEALAEEAVTLDKDCQYKFLKDLPTRLRKIQKECNEGLDKHEVAQKYRTIRKSLMPLCYDKF